MISAGIGPNCEYAEKYLWQFLSQRSFWLPTAQAALDDYDRPSTSSSSGSGSNGGGGWPSGGGEDAGGGSGGEDAGGGTSEQEAKTADSEAQNVQYQQSPHPARQAPQHRYVQALIRHLLLAESGCEAAAENAAWMLLHGQGAGGPRAVGLAAHLLYR